MCEREGEKRGGCGWVGSVRLGSMRIGGFDVLLWSGVRSI
jgi:hypothetical protein